MRKKSGWALNDSDLGKSRIKNLDILSKDIQLKKGLEVHVFVGSQSSGIVVEINFLNKDTDTILEFELENYLELKEVMREGVTLDSALLKEVPPMQLFCMTVGHFLAKRAHLTFELNPHYRFCGDVTVRFECGGYSDTYVIPAGDAITVFDFKN